MEKCKCEYCGEEYSIKGYTCDKITHVCSKQPGLIQKAVNFSTALLEHTLTGRKKCTQEQINERLSICKSQDEITNEEHCRFYKEERCTHKKCGCNVNNNLVFLNKLAWADQECPVDKWKKIE